MPVWNKLYTCLEQITRLFGTNNVPVWNKLYTQCGYMHVQEQPTPGGNVQGVTRETETHSTHGMTPQRTDGQTDRHVSVAVQHVHT